MTLTRIRQRTDRSGGSRRRRRPARSTHATGGPGSDSRAVEDPKEKSSGVHASVALYHTRWTAGDGWEGTPPRTMGRGSAVISVEKKVHRKLYSV
jgi:hypothetical protein